MHCLPLRRNVIATDAVLDSEQSLVIEQANNRTYSAAYIIQKLLGIMSSLFILKIGGELLQSPEKCDQVL